MFKVKSLPILSPPPTQLKYSNCKQEHDIRGSFLRSCLLRGCFPSRLPPPKLPSGMPPRSSEFSGVPVRRRAGRTIEIFLTCKAAPHFESLPIFRRGVCGDTFRSSPIATRPARLAQPTAPKTKPKERRQQFPNPQNKNICRFGSAREGSL